MFAEHDPTTRKQRELEAKLEEKRGTLITIEDALKEWLVSKSKKSDATRSKYKTATKKITLFASQQQIVRVEQFTAQMPQTWVNDWGPDSVYWKMRLRTQGSFLERVKNFFRFCVRMGWLITSPAAHIESITEPVGTTHTKPLTAKECATLLDVTYLYHTSMRPDDRMGAHLRAIIETQR